MQKLFFLLPLTLIFLSCEFHEKSKVRFDEATFNRERAAWESQGIRDYQFTHEYFSGAGPAGPGRIRVRNGMVADIEMLENMSSSEWRLEMLNHTISGIFDLIASYYAEALEEVEHGSGRGASIDVTYNAQYHHPMHVDYTPDMPPGNWDGYAFFLRDITDFSR